MQDASHSSDRQVNACTSSQYYAHLNIFVKLHAWDWEKGADGFPRHSAAILKIGDVEFEQIPFSFLRPSVVVSGALRSAATGEYAAFTYAPIPEG